MTSWLTLRRCCVRACQTTTPTAAHAALIDKRLSATGNPWHNHFQAALARLEMIVSMNTKSAESTSTSAPAALCGRALPTAAIATTIPCPNPRGAQPVGRLPGPRCRARRPLK